MEFDKLPINRAAARLEGRLERLTNAALRTRDRALARLRVGGRAAPYDDTSYEFLGGPADTLRKRQ